LVGPALTFTWSDLRLTYRGTGKPLVVMAESLAENPVLTDAPSQHPASAATEQKRPNAINSSPAELLPTQILRVETAC
jgi:hypothetical protein